MAKQPIGITIVEGGIGVYEHDAGIATFETESPYLLTDGVSLANPMPVQFVDGPVFFDSNGNPQTAIPIRGAAPPADGITWDNNALWDGGTFWS